MKFVDIVNKHTDKKSIEGLTVGEYLLLDIIGKSGGALSENSLQWFKGSALALLWKFPHKLTCQNFLNHMGKESQLLKKGHNKKHRNNSEKNIDRLISKMSFVASAKSEQAETLMDISLDDFKYLYTNSKEHEIFGYRTKHIFFGKEFTTIVTFNKSTLNLQRESYLSRKEKILEKLADLKRRLESDRGKERTKSSVEREVADIILKDFRSIIKYAITDNPEGKKKPQLT